MGDKDAKASGEKKVPFDDNNFRELVASLKLSAYRLDKDKLRRIRAVCSAHTMTCAQGENCAPMQHRLHFEGTLR